MLRPAAVAGSFYPEDPAVLAAVVEDFLAEADGMASERPSKAIIAPHAGYIYSGEIAARVYAAIVPWAERIRRVVLLGP
ncbi:MAG: AmmeMemoRadiSam system protein B, partial [Rhodospirillales bacterium]|nr:AmmeMemoRadiSam system protein B [Rhodospirillales bacterium]